MAPEIINSRVLFIICVLIAKIILLTHTNCFANPSEIAHNQQANFSATPEYSPTSHYQNGQTARKITIIVGDEEPINSSPIVSSPPEPPSLVPEPLEPSLSPTGKGCSVSNRVEPKFYVDETTKLIYVDERNESGFLIGEILNNNGTEGEDRLTKYHEQQQFHRIQKNSNDSISDRFHKSRPSPNFSRELMGNNPTNYSVYLISRNKNHIAILIDVEEINFEPNINCENQELRFSFVGEISKNLTNKSDNGDPGNEDGGSIEESTITEGESGLEGSEQINSDESVEQPSASETDDTPPMPVSEALAIILNAPLNITLLDESDETNDFKKIDSTIDYLHAKTCQELRQTKSIREQLRHHHQSEVKTKINARPKSTNNNGRRKINKPTSRKKHPAVCDHEGKQFKDSMWTKLQNNFEWADFKIICGKVKQLMIPMRSMKLSVFSDEFAPNSKFIIRYKFVSDPKMLPAFDNGKYYCRNRNVIDISLKCNGIDDCDDASDESAKVCGYQSGRSNEPSNQAQSTSSKKSRSMATDKPPTASSPTTYAQSKKKLTYVGGDLIHCCQSNDWMSIIPQGQNNQKANLQSLIGESMNLFLGSSVAPTAKSKPERRRFKRIVGGGVAQKGAWPGQVSLQYELLEPLCHFCAGTLIHPQYVLTAGHCITKEGLNRGIKVVLGAHDLRQLNGSQVQTRYVDDAQIYPGVDVKHLSFDWENDMNNDIALLRLNAPVLITPHVAPACLPPYNTPLSVNTTCRSIGWGETHGSGSSNLLKHLSLKIVNSSLCSKELFDRDNKDKDSPDKNNKKRMMSLENIGKLGSQTGKRSRFAGDFEATTLDQYTDATMICVNNDLGHGICQGDSGGPLYCDRVSPTGEHCTEIYGVASFIIQYATVGAMCAVENLPGIFGEVSSKTEWISSTIKMFEQSYRLKYSS